MATGAISWKAIEDALAQWVRASAIPPAALPVIWENQKAPRPAKPFASLRHDGGTVRGMDEQLQTYIPGNPNGSQVKLSTRAQTEFSCTVDIRTEDVQGDACAVTLATRARNALFTETVGYAVGAAGLAVIDRGTVQNLADLLETRFEGRAAFTVRFRVADGVDELTTWIESVQVTPTFND